MFRRHTLQFASWYQQLPPELQADVYSMYEDMDLIWTRAGYRAFCAKHGYPDPFLRTSSMHRLRRVCQRIADIVRRT
jgi:hypothetical protein